MAIRPVRSVEIPSRSCPTISDITATEVRTVTDEQRVTTILWLYIAGLTVFVLVALGVTVL
jgi:hypothetical protein